MKNLMVKLITVSTITLFLFSTTLKPITFPKFPNDFEHVRVKDITQVEQLSVGKYIVCLISAGEAYCLQLSTTNLLKNIPKKKLTYISVGYDDSVWGVDGNIKTGRNIYDLRFSQHAWAWIKMTPNNLVQISVGNRDNIWGLDQERNLLSLGFWGWSVEKQLKRLKQVSCGADGAVWVIGQDYSVWKKNGKEWKEWKMLFDQHGIKLRQIDVGDKDHIVGTDTENVAYLFTPYLVRKIWPQINTIGEGIKNISINKAGDIWLVTTKGDVYRGKFRVK